MGITRALAAGEAWAGISEIANPFPMRPQWNRVYALGFLWYVPRFLNADRSVHTDERSFFLFSRSGRGFVGRLGGFVLIKAGCHIARSILDLGCA